MMMMMMMMMMMVVVLLMMVMILALCYDCTTLTANTRRGPLPPHARPS